MSRPRSLERLVPFLFVGLVTACNANSGAPQQLRLPEAGGADEVLFKQRCHDCHVPPFPRNHPAGDWPAIVQRMQSHRITSGLTPLSGEELRRIKAYLQRNAKDAT